MTSPDGGADVRKPQSFRVLAATTPEAVTDVLNASRLGRNWRIRSLMIPPVVNKRTTDEPFRSLWHRASEYLRKCERLVVIGYSFPPTDFRARQLLLEALTDPSLREVIVVNPDTTIVNTVRELTHYRGPVHHYQGVQDYQMA